MRLPSPLSRVDGELSKVDRRALPVLSGAVRQVKVLVRRARAAPLATTAVIGVVLAAAVTVGGAVGRPAESATDRGPAWVGPHEGDSVPAYVEQARARLSALVAQSPDQPVYALVSFTEYQRPERLATLFAGAAGVTTVTAYARVPLAGRQTERVALSALRLPADLIDAMTQTALRKDADATAYGRLAADQSAGTLRQIYASNAEVSRAEAAGYRSGCACVFALVVRGAPRALGELAAAAPVRVVDPAPDLASPADAVFAPPLPEQTDRVVAPADDALPSPS